MPTKTKKPPTKTTSKAKTSKKSPSRLDRVIKKFNLARPRNQFIVAFLVVGLLGGGYFAYRSFAESTGVASYFGENVVPYKDSWGCKTGSFGAYSGYTPQAQKKWNNILWISGSGSCAASASRLYASSAANYRMCAVVKGQGSISFPGFDTRARSFYNPSSFEQVCSYWNYKTGGSISRIVLQNNGGSRIDIGTLTLERATAPINSSSPSPSK
jgi:hypothetical protein